MKILNLTNNLFVENSQNARRAVHTPLSLSDNSVNNISFSAKSKDIINFPKFIVNRLKGKEYGYISIGMDKCKLFPSEFLEKLLWRLEVNVGEEGERFIPYLPQDKVELYRRYLKPLVGEMKIDTERADMFYLNSLAPGHIVKKSTLGAGNPFDTTNSDVRTFVTINVAVKRPLNKWFISKYNKVVNKFQQFKGKN